MAKTNGKNGKRPLLEAAKIATPHVGGWNDPAAEALAVEFSQQLPTAKTKEDVMDLWLEYFNFSGHKKLGRALVDVAKGRDYTPRIKRGGKVEA